MSPDICDVIYILFSCTRLLGRTDKLRFEINVVCRCDASDLHLFGLSEEETVQCFCCLNFLLVLHQREDNADDKHTCAQHRTFWTV